MTGKILIQAADVWGFWQKNRDFLKASPRDIAENSTYGIVVELTTSPAYHPEITVFADDDEILREIAYSAADCNALVLEIYGDYITGNPQAELAKYYKSHMESDDVTPEKDRETQIKDREEDLQQAVFDLLLTVFTDTDIPKIEGITDDVLDWFLPELHRRYKFPIYRPMILEDDDGEFFEEFPYEHMIFEEAKT